MTEIEIENIAHLSRVSLSREDCFLFVNKISHILESFTVVQSVQVDDEIELLKSKTRESLRPDLISDGSGQKSAMSNAPQSHEGHFRVPAIL